MRNTENPVVFKSVDFALCIIDFCEELEGKRKFVIVGRFLRA